MKSVLNKIKTKLKSVYEKYGWKAVAGLLTYYLIRDITLYVLLPWYILS